jgi:hypothetical protein
VPSVQVGKFVFPVWTIVLLAVILDAAAVFGFKKFAAA